jgi:hypothetical protein
MIVCSFFVLTVLDLIHTLLIQSVNEEDKMALINAVKDGRTEDVKALIKALIKKGADVNAKESVSRGVDCVADSLQRVKTQLLAGLLIYFDIHRLSYFSRTPNNEWVLARMCTEYVIGLLDHCASGRKCH